MIVIACSPLSRAVEEPSLKPLLVTKQVYPRSLSYLLAAVQRAYIILQRQGNSKLWEKDIEKFFKGKGYVFTRSDNDVPDFSTPLNFDVKTIRADRTTKTFTVAPLTPEQADTGILPYRMVVLVWQYDDKKSSGIPLDAVIVPKEARTVLTNWSFKGIQVKSGISAGLVKQKGILAGRKLPPDMSILSKEEEED